MCRFFWCWSRNWGGAVPSAPGRLGVYHYVAVQALAVFGVAQIPALSFAILLHLLVYVLMGACGAFCLWRESLSVEPVAQVFGGAMISVIVPGYNAEKTVNDCLEALLHQTTPAEDYEIIFVDDGSTDRTTEIVGRYLAVRLLRLPANRGAAAARNAGLQEARGDIILFTDADCAPETNWIEMMRRPFQDATIAGCKGIYRTRTTRACASLCATGIRKPLPDYGAA